MGHPFLSSFALLFRSFRCDCSQPFSQRLMSHLPSALHYYLSVPYVAIIATIPIPWVLQIRKLPLASSCTHGLVTVYFHSFSLLVSFDAVSVPPPGFPSVTICQPTYRDCTLHVPRRLWKVRESNPLLIPGFSGNHPKVCANLSPYSNFACLHQLSRLLPSLSGG